MATREHKSITKSQIQDVLDRLGNALTTGDLKSVSECWHVPALVLMDDDVRAVTHREEVESFFSKAVDWYRENGLMSTRPKLEHVEVLSDKLAAVDVRWPAFDASGKEKASERSHYILQVDNHGDPRIRVALTRPS